MYSSSPVFAQITSVLYPTEFSRCADAFPMAKPPRGLSAYDHWLALAFGQLTYRESLRDIVACLHARRSMQYHLGFRGNISRTNLAYASAHRDWRIFAAVAEVLMSRASRLYHHDLFDSDLPNLAFALDSSIIQLSLKLFPWGYYARSQQAAVKLHLLLSLKGNVPAWGAITEANVPDMKMLDQIPILPGSYYVMDRGYLDFMRLHHIDQQGGYFVVRSKHHVKFAVRQSRPVEPQTNLRCDQTIVLSTKWSKRFYPQPLRRIKVYDPEHQLTLVLLTNNFEHKAAVIAELYRRRWQVELFFKWIKQHLKIRSFYGRSENAVRCQIWAAISTYLMVAILKKQLRLDKSLYQILQILSVSAFVQLPLIELLTNSEPDGMEPSSQNMLTL